MIEYVGIYLEKQSAEYAKILYKLLSSYRKQRRIQNTVKHLRCIALQKE